MCLSRSMRLQETNSRSCLESRDWKKIILFLSWSMRLKERNSCSCFETQVWKTDILDLVSKFQRSLSLDTVTWTSSMSGPEKRCSWFGTLSFFPKKIPFYIFIHFPLWKFSVVYQTSKIDKRVRRQVFERREDTSQHLGIDVMVIGATDVLSLCYWSQVPQNIYPWKSIGEPGYVIDETAINM